MKVWVVSYVSHGCISDVEVFSSELEAEVFKRSLMEDDYDQEDDDIGVYECKVDNMIRSSWPIRFAVTSELATR